MLIQLYKMMRSPLGVGLLVGVLALLLGGLFVRQLHLHHDQAEQHELQSLLARHALQLEYQLNQAMAVNELLAVLLKSEGGVLDAFEAKASGLLAVSSSLSHLSLAPGGVIQQAFPLAGNETSIGFDLLADPLQGPDARLAMQQQRQLVSGPLDLVQGGQAFILRLPVFLDNAAGAAEFWGFTSIVLRMEALLAAAGFDALTEQGLVYRFYHHPADQARQLVYASSQALLPARVVHEVQLPNGYWLLEASALESWQDSLHHLLELLPVVLVSLLMGLLAAQMQHIEQMNRHLERKVAQRTSELQIAAMAFQSQNGILVTDAEQRILKVNQAFQAITGYSEADVLGQTPALLNSGRHGPVFYQQMYASLLREGRWQGEIWNRRKNGEIYPEHLTITAIHNPAGQVTHYVASLVDQTEQKASQDRIYRLKYFDTLTCLPNRALLLETLREAIAEAVVGHEHMSGSLLFLDLDHFKQFNDALGHAAGDELLQLLSERLGAVLPPEASLSRLGSDEFVVLLQQSDQDQAQTATAAEKLAEKLIAVIKQPFVLGGQAHHITASIGVTLIHADDQPEELLKQAELAMFRAKARGRNAIHFYEQAMQQQAIDRLALQAAMYEALQQQDFELHYQPQVNASGYICGVEALIRWNHPQRGAVSPAEFIPLAEETELILKIGDWVLWQAFSQAERWSHSASTSHLVISVNVSARQFAQADFVARMEQVLRQTGANPRRLQLELTESMLADDTRDIIAKMQQLKALGLLISLDDFGTGYSSLSYLQQLPLDQLKVDQSFVRDINPQEPQRALAASIIALGLSLELEVIAEGIETPEQLAFLQQQGCQLFQGYLLGRPMPVASLEERLHCRE